MDQGSSLLLDIDGLLVDSVGRNADGRRVVGCVTDPAVAGWCPQCGEQSRWPKQWYRRELAWTRRGRRGRKKDPEWAQRNRLLRAGETLTAAESAKMHAAMKAADPSGGLQKCWNGKEKLRTLLKLAGTGCDRRAIWCALTDFYTHCANSEAPQLRRLARTVNAWQHSIIAGLLTGISNGRSEGYNRIVKHVGRIAFGFRNIDNHKRRIRYAGTRRSRRATTSLKPC